MQHLFDVKAVKVPSRGINVPAVVTVPKISAKAPLVLLVHGHGGSKEEGGGFVAMAALLAQSGIASIRMDFAGCGESTECFKQNCMTTMLADIRACRAYVLETENIDATRIGMLGFSMGGRLAMCETPREDYKAVVLLAPGAFRGQHLVDSFLGNEKEKYIEEIEKNGFVTFTNLFGHVQDISAEWLRDILALNPLDEFEKFTEDLMLIYGSADNVVPQEISLAAVGAAATSARSIKKVLIEGADHGFGFYDGREHLKAATVAAVRDFFADKLGFGAKK